MLRKEVDMEYTHIHTRDLPLLTLTAPLISPSDYHARPAALSLARLTLLVVVGPFEHHFRSSPVACHDIACHLVSHWPPQTKVKDLYLTVFTHSYVAGLQVLCEERERE